MLMPPHSNAFWTAYSYTNSSSLFVAKNIVVWREEVKSMSDFLFERKKILQFLVETALNNTM